MNSLKEYGDLFERLDLTELSVKEGDFELTLKKKSVVLAENAKVGVASEKAAIENAVSEEEPKAQIPAGTEVKAPLLGIFSGKIGEKQPVKIGDKVKKGDILCTIEAMKMLNEVEAPADGVITDISAKDGDLVEYNQVLFKIA
jgi:acetyl-CoA carboxylase biotin carboxyl carrier protein